MAPDSVSILEPVAPLRELYRMTTHVGMPAGHAAHFHADTLEICYISHGRLDWWVGEEVFELRPGDFLVMRPGQPHGSVDSTLQPCEYTALQLDVSASDGELFKAVSRPEFGGQFSNVPDAAALMSSLFDEHLREGLHGTAVCRSTLELLIFTLSRHAQEKTTGPGQSPLVRRAMRRLLKDEHRSLSSVANELGVSRMWLTKLFWRDLGQTPRDWVRGHRTGVAKRRLVESDDPVIEIAIELGYASSQYFATAFKRETGLTPTEYRARSKESAAPVVAV